MREEPQLPSSRTDAPPAEPRLPSSVATGAEPRLPSVSRSIDAVGEPASQPPTSVASADVAAATHPRRDRIARVTAAGGLQELPVGFDERDGDWETVRSDNPFEALYLDHEAWSRITQETVERHYKLLSDFWQTKKLRMHSGAA